ncbi:MAG: tail-specific protease, partial [Candidatus Aminicenantes bacterium]|nr:tail-specific protease [Candidatus Aminicenantes bacterium]NIT24621.1 tail-specific protease [Candidatus Aminicenantes bacterium]
NALPWDKVAPAKYIQVSAPVDSFSIARETHQDRIKSDKSFNLYLKQLALIREANEKKEISLLESERKKEREQIQKTKHKLTNELRVAQGLEPIDLETEQDH